MKRSNLDNELSEIPKSKTENRNLSDGDVVYSYLCKKFTESGINWVLEDISENLIQIGNEIPENSEYKQVILKGDYEEKSDNYFNLNITETVQISRT